MTCPLHPKYKAILPPHSTRAGCVCRKIYNLKFRKMWRATLCLVVFFGIQAGVASAQQAPNCNQQNFLMTGAGTTTSIGLTTQFNATSVKCVAWTFSYFSNGFSAISIQVEQAADNNGVPGAFSAVPAANIAGGTNPLTSTNSGTMLISGYFPWMRVNLVTATGTGSVNYTLIGNSYVGAASQISSSAGTPGTVIAIGPDAPGAAPTKNPVLVAGWDNTNVRRLVTDNAGRLFVAAGTTTAPDGVNPNAAVSFGANGGVAPLLTTPYFFDGATQLNKARAAALNSTTPASTLTTISVGAQQVEKSNRFSVVSTPAVSTQASASVALQASTRHVADCITFSAGSTTAPALTKLTINLRDGATGAGTIIHSWTVVISAATGQNVAPQTFCGLNLAGTAGTAMTLEFSALLTNLFEDVTLTGYNIQ